VRCPARSRPRSAGSEPATTRPVRRSCRRWRAPAPKVPSPGDVATLITTAQQADPALALFVWLAAVTGARRAELCALRWHRIDPGAATIHIARTYVVSGGQRIDKDTKTHQDRRLAIDPATCGLLRGFKEQTAAARAAAGLTLAQDAFVFSNDSGTTPCNPDWVTHQVARAAAAAGVAVNIKSLRHSTATHLPAAGLDITTTAARPGHGSGGATTLKVYAHPVAETGRRAAALLAGTLTP
jgi:integrase